MKAQSDSARLVQGLKKLRKRLGLSQQTLAVRLGITLPTVSRWENKHSLPSPLALEKIETFLRELDKDGADLLRRHFDDES